MITLENIVSCIFSYHLAALRRDRLGSEDVEDSLRVSAGFTVASPLISLLIIAVGLIYPIVGIERIKLPILIAVSAIILGVPGITDKIYRKKVPSIESKAAQILNDPNKGRSWARRRLLAILVAQLAGCLIIITFGRLIVQQSTWY